MPGFHAAYLEAMIQVFDNCAERTVEKLEKLLDSAQQEGKSEIDVEMESEYSNLALDIIGLSVFNYDFGSVTRESPVIAVSFLLSSQSSGNFVMVIGMASVLSHLLNLLLLKSGSTVAASLVMNHQSWHV